LKIHRNKLLIIAVSTLVFLLVVLPYLIPLSDSASTISSELLVSPSGRFLNIGSDTIYVEEQGTSSQKAIVFIHGFGGSTFTWRDNIPFFTDRGYRTIALDLKGFGISSRDTVSDYTHKSQAILVSEVLKQLQVEQAYLIGHSMGVSVMFHLAHLYPKRVLGLVSVDGAVNLKTGPSIPSMLLRFPPFQRAARVFLTRYIDKARFVSILESACYRKEILTPDVIDAYYNRAIRKGWDESLLAMTRDMPGNVIDFPLNTMEFPLLVIRGENDTWVSQADTDEWKVQIPDYQFFEVPDAGHLPMEEQTAVFNELVLDFLGSIGNQDQHRETACIFLET